MLPLHDAELVFLPLGGAGEIGMNLAVYGYGPQDDREWLVVDMGVSFAGPEFPGVDLVFPDIRFLESERHNIRGLILTHAHEDHFGAVPDLWSQLKVPVYCTAFTAGLLEAKQASGPGSSKVPLHVVEAGDRFELGCFEIETVPVAHSVPDAVSLVIRSPLGVVVHTGDWKIDKEPQFGALTDEKRFCEIGQDGVLALVCDSTNAMIETVSPTESEISRNLEKIISNASGCVAVTTFASNIGRIKSIALAARETGRRVLLVGRSVKRSVAVAEELGYLEGIEPFLNEEDYAAIPHNKVVLVLAGSQGEPRAALAKIARGEMRDITLASGDTLIYSSRSIPGNEKAIIDTQNLLIDRGIRVITSDDESVHVSGHPCRGHLRQMYQWIKPQILVPVHGEASHLVAHASLGTEAGIKQVVQVRNGNVLRLAPGAAEVIDQAPVGRIYKDGKLLGDEDSLGIRERRKLGYAGHVVVSLLLDRSLELVGQPRLVAFGLPETDGSGVLVEDILLESIENTVHNISGKKRRDESVVREAVNKTVRSAVYEVWGKKTIVTVFLHRIQISI